MYEETVRSYLGLFLLGLLSSFGSVVSPVLPQYAEHLGASYGEIGLFFSAYSLTWSFLQLYTGYLSDRYGRKRFAMLGLSIYGFSLTLMGSSQNFMQLIIFRVLQGCWTWGFWTFIFRLGCPVEGEGGRVSPSIEHRTVWVRCWGRLSAGS